MKPARATPALAAGPAAESSSSPPSEPSSSVLVGSEPDEVLEPDSSLPSVSVDEGLSVSVSVSVSVPVVTVSVAVVVPLVGAMVGMVVGASVSVTSESVLVASVAETLIMLLTSVGSSVMEDRTEEISLPMEETAPEQISWAAERAWPSSEVEHSDFRQSKEPSRIASKLVQRQVTSVAPQPESGRASPMQLSWRIEC